MSDGLSSYWLIDPETSVAGYKEHGIPHPTVATKFPKGLGHETPTALAASPRGIMRRSSQTGRGHCAYVFRREGKGMFIGQYRLSRYP